MKACSLSMLAGLALLIRAASGQVVINEIFYHAPDDLPKLQWIELFNPSDDPADLSNWRLSRGVKFHFSPGTTLAAHGFLVLCQDREQFQRFYSTPVAGQFDGSLKKSADHLELRDAQGRVVDRVSYSDRPPWPQGPDGNTASLERICPGASGELPENWMGSPLSEDDAKPGGSPGQKNSAYSAALPPVISQVRFSPTRAEPGQPIEVEARVANPAEVREVTLLYRAVGVGAEGPEQALPMQAKPPLGTYSTAIPGQAQGQIVRLRVRVTGAQGAERFFPRPTDLHPTLSCLVFTNLTTGRIPVGFILHTDAAEVDRSNQTENGQFGPDREGQARFMIQMRLDGLLDLPGLWAALTLSNPPPASDLERLRSLFAGEAAELERLRSKILESKDVRAAADSLPEQVRPIAARLDEELKPLLKAGQEEAFARWRERQAGEGGRTRPAPPGMDPSFMLKQFIRLEPAYFHLALNTNLTAAQFAGVSDAYRAAFQEREALGPKLRQVMAGGRAGAGVKPEDQEDLQARVMAIEPKVDQQLRTVLNPAEARKFAAWRLANSPGFMRKNAPKPAEEPLGRAAFVYVDAGSSEPRLFDFVHAPGRSGGWKVHFSKQDALNGMSAINLIFESNERWVLAEPLAYDLHRLAGLPAPRTDFVRLWVDGRLVGYHLLIEQPNKAFLRHNGLRDDGNLYKANWAGRGLAGQNEKRTHRHGTHDDLIQLVDQLEATKAKPAEQWDVIKRKLDVEEVLNHYAVRMLLSDWDGFFNNYYLYHDRHGSGKWMFFPWDEDKTWGEYDGWQDHPLYNLPLTYGAEGDHPPGRNPGDRESWGFNAGAPWWRPGGYIARPVLANPEFRTLFLARLKELLQTEFTEAKLFPLVDGLKNRLADEIPIRAEAMHADPAQARQQFEANLASLKTFIVKRRQWLLAQDAIQNAGPFDRALLALPTSASKPNKQ